jgi:hypothetical protein
VALSVRRQGGLASGLDIQTSAARAALVVRSQRALQHPFKFPLEQLKLCDPLLHRRELVANQREQARADSRAGLAIQRDDEGFEVAERQPQRACTTDEAHPLHARLTVLSIA